LTQDCRRAAVRQSDERQLVAVMARLA